MRLTYVAKYQSLVTNRVGRLNTPGMISYSHFATREGAQHLINQFLSENPGAKKKCNFYIATEYVDDDYKYVKERY